MKKRTTLLFICCLLGLLLTGCTRTLTQDLSDASDYVFSSLAQITDCVVDWLAKATDFVIDALSR